MKILLYDIETAPNLAYVWGKYQQDVIDYEKEWYLLCFAYKWLGDKNVKAESLVTSQSKDPTNDEHLVKILWKLFDEADIVIAHNGDAFDNKKVFARFAAYGMKPPSPFKTVDTKKAAKRYFMFNSNKLDDLGNYFGIGRKINTGGFELWKGCMTGDKKAWHKMIKYNKQDVVLLEKVYNRLLPWIGNHPNVNLYHENDIGCPNCHSTHFQSRGFDYTASTKKRKYQCQACGKWFRGKTVGRAVEYKS